jgi:hypothetical protein
MVVTQGYETWLAQGDRLEDTEECWAKMDRTDLIEAIMKHKPETVIEFCCGTGWIPKGMSLDVQYVGLDANEGCIELAKEKNPTRQFFVQDVREWHGLAEIDMGLAFSCLKHFQLYDLDQVYGKLLKACKKTLTTVYLRPDDFEEQQHPYIHTGISMEHMERVIEENGHRLVQVFTLPPLNTMKEPLVLTEKVDADKRDGADLVSAEGLRESGGDVGVPLREGLLGGVQDEAGDPGGEDPDLDEEGSRDAPLGTTEWPL